jgi:hypothetical protein
MRIIVPLTLVVAGFAGLSSLALARGSKPISACSAAAVIEPAAERCTASARLCENWLKGREAFRATFPNYGQQCG